MSTTTRQSKPTFGQNTQRFGQRPNHFQPLDQNTKFIAEELFNTEADLPKHQTHMRSHASQEVLENQPTEFAWHEPDMFNPAFDEDTVLLPGNDNENFHEPPDNFDQT